MKAKAKIAISIGVVAVLVGVGFAIKFLNNENKKGSPTLLAGSEHHKDSDKTHFEEVLEKKTEEFIKHQTSNGTEDDKKKKILQSFAKNSVIESDFNSLNSMLDAQIANIEKLELPADKKEKITSAFRDVFDTGAIYDAYLSEIYKNYSAEELQELDTIYSNELVKKSLHELHEIGTPEGQKNFAEYLKNLPNKGLSEARKAQLAEYDQVTGLSINSARLVNSVMALLTPPGQASSPTDKAQMDQYMASKIKEGVMFSLAKAHDGLSDTEMKSLIELRSKAPALKEVKTRADVISLALTSPKAKQGFDKILENAN